MAQKLTPIKIPLLNPNEPEALLVSVNFKEGDPVESEQVLAVIETTKSTGEILVEEAGYLVGLRFQPGQTLAAGETLAYIADTPNAADPTLPPWMGPKKIQAEDEDMPEGFRITEPARALALAEGISFSSLPQGVLVTRQIVEDLLQKDVHKPMPAKQKDDERLVIYGAGGHGRSLAALIKASCGDVAVGFLDDGIPAKTLVDGLQVLGGMNHLYTLAQEGIVRAVNGVGGISDLHARLEVYAQLAKAGFTCPTVIHRTAFIEESALIADGTQVFPFAYVGISVKVGYGCIINTGAIISHDCELARYVNLSPGATLAGGVSVGEAALIGMRATVNLNVRIGTRARIGNGATVKADVPDGGIVPAGTIWPPRP